MARVNAGARWGRCRRTRPSRSAIPTWPPVCAPEEIVWLTTVDGRGQPQSSPVWFHWDGTDLLVLSQPAAPKVANISAHPEVALHLDGAQAGAVVVTIEGHAAIRHTAHAARLTAHAARLTAYGTKYRPGFARLGTDEAAYLEQFSTSIVIRPTRARVFPST